MKVEASEQYIPKSVLVAELKKRFDYRVNGLKAINNGTFWDEDQSEDELNKVLTRCAYNAAKNEVFELMCFLDTHEVKEVDLEKEISFQWSKFCLNSKDKDSFVKSAKHFFELGLKAQKGE